MTLALELYGKPPAIPAAVDVDLELAVHNLAFFDPDLACISYGSSGGPTFSTDIIEMDSGQEVRVARRGSFGKYRYSILVNQADSDVVEYVTKFALSRNGSLFGFRHYDHRDFSSHSDGTSDGSALGDRIILATGNGIETVYQLQKPYTDTVSGITTVRKITRPVDGTTRVWIDDIEQTITTHFTVDIDTGRISFVTAPAVGEVVTVSFSFHVLVRFGESVDEWLERTQNAYETSTIRLSMVELLDRGEFADTPLQFGGYHDYGNFAAGIVQLRYANGFIQDITPTASGVIARLWDETNMPEGGPFITLYNRSGAESLTLQDFAGATLGVLAADQHARMMWTGSTWRFG